MVNARRDVANSLILLVFCGLAFFLTTQIEEQAYGVTGASFFPKIVISLLAFLALCYLVTSVARARKDPTEGRNQTLGGRIRDNRKVLLTFVVFGIYVAALPYLGYLLSSAAFLLASHLLISSRKTKMAIVVPAVVVVTLLLFLVFENGLSVFLPRGVLF